MLERNYRDIVAGALLILIGVGAALYAWANYRLGTFAHMGPGMFPFMMGTLLSMIGLLILGPAIVRSGPGIPMPDFRAAFFILLALFAFSMTIRTLGLVPAIVLVTVISVFADNKMGIVSALVLAAGLSLLGWLIFRVGLGIPLETFISPWR